ncbi:MAG: hypothetical protein NXI32_26365 [bacterium]|nr:hypothetical protein [bacterium]
MTMLSGRMHWLTVGLALLVSAQGWMAGHAFGQAPTKPASAAANKLQEDSPAPADYGMQGAPYGTPYSLPPHMVPNGVMPTAGMMPPGGMPPGMMPGGMPGMMPGGMPPGVMPASMPGGMPGGMPAGMMGDAPSSMAFQGPPPMEATFAGGYSSCDSSCDAAGGCQGCGGCNSCGGAVCGGSGCHQGGLFSGGLLGGGCKSCGGGMCGGRGCGSGGLFGNRACHACGGMGCMACGGRGHLGHGGLTGACLALLGPLAPFSEGGRNAQRWFDVYLGTIGLVRTSDLSGVATGYRDQTTGEFLTTDVISNLGIGVEQDGGFPLTNNPVLSISDIDQERMRFGLEAIVALQTGVGSGVEVRYFGLNNWSETKTVSTIASGVPNLYSVFSLYGTDPQDGFDDTDRSFSHSLAYNSELHNGEVNYRSRWVSGFGPFQGSILGGIRYFDLDEKLGFRAVGSFDNTFTFDQLRFFDYETQTRNQLTGVQIGGDLWWSLLPGLSIGTEGKMGVFGNHAEVESQVVANSIPGAREHLQDGKTAYLVELNAQLVYRLSYSWSVRTGYNMLYVDNVALATQNFNTRDFSNAIGGGNFTLERFPFIDTDGEVAYNGFSIGAEWLY